jgi:hypothetical protein
MNHEHYVEEFCEECEELVDDCDCLIEPDHDPDYDYTVENVKLEYDSYGQTGPDYWRNDAGEWRCG